MNPIDKAISYFSPNAGLKRVQARQTLDLLANYEGAKSNRMRKRNRDSKSSNNMVENDAVALRGEARHLQRNHDLSRGAIRTIVNNIVGQKGIGVEPQPRVLGTNEIHEAYAAALLEHWKDWCVKPEVTHRHSFSKVQRLIAAAWLRDGEGFGQMLMGRVPLLDHGTAVPFSIELFEADMIPMNYNDKAKNIRQGIRLNAWNRPRTAYVFKSDPLEAYQLISRNDLKSIPWENILHIAAIDRIGQLRGVSEFASVITRLLDIKDYEESERIAAKIAASLAAYVKKGEPAMYPQPNGGGATAGEGESEETVRDLSLEAGIIIDDLLPGEEIGMIDSKRPNPNLVTFRQGQLKAFAAGIGGSYSSISRDYDGNYSAQRQELIEQWVNYAVLTDEMVGQIVQPIWKRFVLAAHLSGVVPRPEGLVPLSFDDALFVGQSMPWIDPLKEAMGAKALIGANLASEVSFIRKRGENPNDVISQKANFRKQAKEKGLVFEDATTSVGSQPADNKSTNNEEE